MTAPFDVNAFVRTLELASKSSKAEEAKFDEFLIQGLEDAAAEGESAMDALCQALAGRLDLIAELVDLAEFMVDSGEGSDDMEDWVIGTYLANSRKDMGLGPVKASFLAFFEFMGDSNDMDLDIEIHIPVGKDMELLQGIEVRFYATTTHGIRFLWDRISIETQQAAGVTLAIVFQLGDVSVHCWTRDTWTPNALFRFHPERYRFSRKFAAEAAKRRAGGMTMDMLQQDMMALMQAMNESLLGYPRRLTLQDDDSSRMTHTAEMGLLNQYCNFVATGRQIFDIPPALAAMFRETDMDDIPLSMLKAPYLCLFIHFGPQEGMEFKPGWKVDGVYIELNSETQEMSLLFTTLPATPGDIRYWGAMEEPHFKATLSPEYFGMTVGKALEKWLQDEVGDLDNQLSAEEVVPADELKRMGEEAGYDIALGTKARLAAEKRALEGRAPVMRAGLRLAINALCYLTAYGDDIKREWPEGTPERLRLQATTGTEKERNRARSKLESQGYVPIHVCGTAIAQTQGTGWHATTPKNASHWRRGHWRQQPYGEKRSLRKLIWVMPILVNADKGVEGEEPLGHMYLVS